MCPKISSHIFQIFNNALKSLKITTESWFKMKSLRYLASSTVPQFLFKITLVCKQSLNISFKNTLSKNDLGAAPIPDMHVHMSESSQVISIPLFYVTNRCAKLA